MKKFIITMVLAFALITTASAAPLKSTTLRVGSTGQTVMTVQQKLLDLGLSDSVVDGKYGKKTAAAVAKFQLLKGLKNDGLVGEKTLALIMASKASSTTISDLIKPIPNIPPVVVPEVPVTADELAWRVLCRDMKPHIQVLSPNGGEVYQAGQNMAIKWRTCNDNSDSSVHVILSKYLLDYGHDFGSIRAGSGSTNVIVPSTLSFLDNPTNGNTIPVISGMYYKVILELRTNIAPSNAVMASDVSNNLFTINAPTIDICPNIYGIQTTIPTGMIKDSMGNCVTVSAWDVLCRDGQPHVQVLSPNGGEIYEAGKQVLVKWKTCNVLGNIAEINLIPTNGWSMGIGITFEKDLINDGQEIITLPNTYDFTSANKIYGKRFKMEVNTAENGNIQSTDFSDNLFTINPVGIINPKTTTQSSAY